MITGKIISIMLTIAVLATGMTEKFSNHPSTDLSVLEDTYAEEDSSHGLEYKLTSNRTIEDVYYTDVGMFSNMLFTGGFENNTGLLQKWDENLNLITSYKLKNYSHQYFSCLDVSSSSIYVGGEAEGGSIALILKYNSNLDLLWKNESKWDFPWTSPYLITDLKSDGRNLIVIGTYRYETGGVIMEYSENGILLWNKSWKPSLNYSSAGFSRMDQFNDSIFITAPITFQNNTDASYIFKFDSIGNEISNISISTKVYDIKEWKGSIYVIGQFSIIKYDQDLNIIRDREIGMINTSDTATNEQSLIITGEINNDVRVQRFDTNLNLLWKEDWGDYNENRPWGIIADEDSIFIVGWSPKVSTGFILKFSSNDHPPIDGYDNILFLMIAPISILLALGIIMIILIIRRRQSRIKSYRKIRYQYNR